MVEEGINGGRVIVRCKSEKKERERKLVFWAVFRGFLWKFYAATRRYFELAKFVVATWKGEVLKFSF